MKGAVIDQMNDALAQFRGGVYVDLARDPQDGAIARADGFHVKGLHAGLRCLRSWCLGCRDGRGGRCAGSAPGRACAGDEPGGAVPGGSDRFPRTRPGNMNIVSSREMTAEDG
jgi:hypothetical protein